MLIAGTVLNARYRIDRPLDLGAMGAMYRGWDLERDVPVSIKELTPQPDLGPEAVDALREQFDAQAGVLMRLRHPHMVHVVDAFHAPDLGVAFTPPFGEGPVDVTPPPPARAHDARDNTYLVMDFVEGESLAARVKRGGAQREDEVLRWAAQVLDALVTCHEQGILHRDIKPENVILRPEGGAVLVGFELAKLWDPNNPRTWTATRVMGSPEYAPPERWGLQTWHIDERSDVYSLGATLYYALTGTAPLTAGERTANPYQFQPVKALSPDVSARTRAAVLHAMELPRDKRFQSAGALREALFGAALPPDSELVAPAPLILASTRWARFRRRLVVLALSAAILSLAGLAGTLAHYTLAAVRRPFARPTTPPVAVAEVTATAPATAAATAAATVAPTAAPTPRPTATRLAPTRVLSPSLAPVPWPVTLGDAFDDNGSDWIVGDYEDDWGAVSRVITEGVYLWNLSAAQSVSRWCMPEISRTADFYLAVDAQRVRGPANASYGLVFRHADGNYYLFSVRDDGYVRFSLWYDFAWTVIQDWTETLAVYPGGVNRLAVLAEGPRVTLSVNGRTVIEAEDEQLTAGESGLSAMLITPGEAVFHFDNFELRAQP